MTKFLVPLVLFVVLLLLGGAWWVSRGPARRQAASAAIDDRASVLPRGAPSQFFTPQAIGDAIRGEERPQISNVQLVDLDRDGLMDVLVCDVLRGRVTWIRQFPKGTFTETAVGDPIKAPAHVEAIDVDRDGDLDLVVASLGVLNPSNNRVGSVIVLENVGQQRFVNHVVAEGIARVADVRAGDLDGDGDLDLAVAGFGYDDGETSWLENKGGWTFEQHVLLRLSGPINAIVADVNRDGSPDIVALVSQEWEEIWVFVNDGRGHFTSKMIWGSTNADFGSSWISVVDLDRDGDLDVLYSNGDAFDYAPANSRPWHGVQWLENKGNLEFTFHRIADLPGASSPQAADVDGDGDLDVLYSNGDAFDYAPANSRPWHGVQWLENRGNLEFTFHRIADLPGASSPQAADVDGDGDLDVVVVSAYNNWDDPGALSLVWLENNGRMQFTLHAIAMSPTHLITLAAGDLDGDGVTDLVTGGMYISHPYDRMSRITAWSHRGPAPQR